LEGRGIYKEKEWEANAIRGMNNFDSCSPNSKFAILPKPREIR